MACCRAEEFDGWCQNLGTVVHRDGPKEYCTFHAPWNKKEVSLDEFNERVFLRINNARSRQGESCNLAGTIFPGDIDFSRFNEQYPLPPIDLTSAEFTRNANFHTVVFSGDANFSKATFAGNVTFNKTIFNEGANFVGSQFNEGASFKEAYFPWPAHFDGVHSKRSVDFSDAIFDSEAYFNEAEFKGPVNFTGGVFREEVDFSGTVIAGMADFHNRSFVKRANFTRTRFNGRAQFSGINFKENAEFGKAAFSDVASFEASIFSRNASFAAAQFNHNANFGGASFIGKTDFQQAGFMGYADFQFASFQQSGPDQHADFRAAYFSDGVNFSGSRFHLYTTFYRATFSHPSRFNGAVFGKQVSFQEANINSPIEFLTTVFARDVTFMCASFSDAAEARFDGAIFQNRADFSHTQFHNIVTFYPYPPIHLSGFSVDSSPIVAQFCGEADFIRTSFRAKCYFKQTAFKKRARFEDLMIERRLRFENVDLFCVSLIDVELDNIQFIDATWPRKDGKDSKRYQLIEEKSSESSSWRIEAYYRRLKKRAKDEHNQSEVSEWHYCEKQIALKRAWLEWKRFLAYWLLLRWISSKEEKPPKAGCWALPILCLYWGSSGYGERPLRAGIVLICLILGITIIMGLYGLTSAAPGEDMLIGFSHFWLLFYNTIENALFFKETLHKPIIPIPDGLMQTFFTRILIPIQFALFALALRNKFRR